MIEGESKLFIWFQFQSKPHGYNRSKSEGWNKQLVRATMKMINKKSAGNDQTTDYGVGS